MDQTASEYGNPLQDEHARDYAVREYKAYLKTVRKRKPTTVNIALAAIDHFYHFLQMSPARVKREDLPQQAPRALTEVEQKHFCERWSAALPYEIGPWLYCCSTPGYV